MVCCLNSCDEAICVAVVSDCGGGGSCRFSAKEADSTPVAASKIPRPCLSLGESPPTCSHSRRVCDSGEDLDNGGCCSLLVDRLGLMGDSGPSSPFIDSISVRS